MQNKLVTEQPAPVKNSHAAVWDLVVADISDMAKELSIEHSLVASLVVGDMRSRDAEGLKRYGTRLQAFNGRNAKVDCYQEILDGIVYARQEIEEGNQEMQYIYKRLISVAFDLRRMMHVATGG